MKLQEAITKTLEYLRGRKLAYNLVFRMDQPADQEVLRDLAWFCRANESCAVPGNHDKTMILEGRREVFLRIQQHINLTPEQLFDLYSGPRPSAQTKETRDD